MPGYLCFSLRFLQEKKGEREREREMRTLRDLGCLNFEGKKKPERERKRERERETASNQGDEEDLIMGT